MRCPIERPLMADGWHVFPSTTPDAKCECGITYRDHLKETHGIEMKEDSMNEPTIESPLDGLLGRIPLPGEIWKHYKNGDLYEVIALARREDTGRIVVLYRAYQPTEKRKRKRLWDRDLALWVTEVRRSGTDRFTPRYELTRL